MIDGDQFQVLIAINLYAIPRRFNSADSKLKRSLFQPCRHQQANNNIWTKSLEEQQEKKFRINFRSATDFPTINLINCRMNERAIKKD